MATARIRDRSWKHDEKLKDSMKLFVSQGLKRYGMLDFLKRGYPQYAWSSRTLDRRLCHFEIRYSDKEVTVDQVREAVQKEINGPGKLLGYRAMQNKLRQHHDLLVP